MNWSSIVGLESAKRALLLLAAEPLLGGVAMAATVGSGKSTLARAFAALLPAGTPFVELPVNITEDRLLGGLDLEATLASGARVAEKGLLAKADGGVLYVDGLNLLDSSVAAQIMDVLGRGEVRVEREGLSVSHPARFMLIGTYDISDGEVRGGLLDRMGLIVPFTSNGDSKARAEVVRQNREGDAERDADAQDGTEMLRGMIGFAREQLAGNSVSIQDSQLEGIAQAALSLGVEGNRVDVFAARAAIAHAALSGRTEVDDEDLEYAAKLVLMPRATRMPEPEQQADQPQPEQPQPQPQPDQPESEDQPPPEQPEKEQAIEELLLSAVEAALPGDVLNLPFSSRRRGKSGSRGVQLNERRGKFVRAVPGELRGNKLALLPTLMAAAPWQKMRRLTDRRTIILRKDDIRIKKFRDKAGTLFVFVVDASGSMALNRMRQAKGAVAKLLQNAYVHRDQVALVAFRGKEAQLLLAPSTSVERAKRELDVLPTGGGTPLASALALAWDTAQQARRKNIPNTTLVLMTDGRGNVGLAAGRPVAGQAGPSGAEATDRAASRQKIDEEVQALSALIAADGVDAVVIDTQVNYLSRGEAPKLAKWLTGRYVYLPNAQADQIVSAIA